MIKNFKNLIFLFVIIPNLLKAQFKIKELNGQEFIELVKIADRYEHSPNLSFTIHLSYTDSAKPKVILDSNTIAYRMSNGNAFADNKEMEMLKNDSYLIYIDKLDSAVYLNNATPKTILQLPLMDSLFRKVQIKKIVCKDVDDTTRKLTFLFHQGSYYHGYEITYKPDVHLIRQIKYYIPSGGNYNLPGESVICITLNVNDYSVGQIAPAVFNEERYIYLLNNKFFLQPAYQKFRLQSHL